MDSSKPSTPLPSSLTDKLADFRAQVQRVKFLEGVLAGVFGLLLTFLVVFVFDRFVETPPIVRGVLLVAGVAVSAIGLPMIWHHWVHGQRRFEDVAKVVSKAFPRLGDQLLGTIELAHDQDGAATKRSDRLVSAAIEQAADRVKDEDLSGAIPAPKHRNWAWAAGIVGALALTAAIVVPPAAGNALARWSLPWSDTERYTFAQVDDLPETLVVPFAEEFELTPALREETEWTPSKASASIPGQPKLLSQLDESGTNAVYSFTLPPQKEDAELQLRVGDDRERVLIQPRTRPELTELTGTLRLPEYLQYQSEPVVEARGGTVRLLQGAKVSWNAAASRKLAKATIDGEQQPIKAGRIITEFVSIDSSREHTFEWVDSLDLSPRNPLVLKVNAVEDAAPQISARRESLEQVVLETETISFEVAVEDDFGVRQVGLEWSNPYERSEGEDGSKPMGEKLVAAGAPETRSLAPRATFCASELGIAPGVIEVRAWADDYLPNRERAYSPAFALRILDNTEHALWLTEQFGRWLGAARETYEREQQLNVTNKELRELDSSELDRPENRRKVARQAADEQANSSRLNALTQMGSKLVEQGTKNPEFSAGQLESWAAMNERLEALAKERMPTVADLLQESSRAEKAGQQTAGDPSKAQPTGDQKPSDSSAEGSPSEPSDSDSPSKPSQAGAPMPSKPQGPKVSHGEENQTPSLPTAPGEAEEKKPDEPLPSLADNEKSYLDPPEIDPDAEPQPPSPSGGGKFGLPQTTLGALGSPEAGECSPAQEKLDQAIAEQDNLLEEFKAVSDLLSELLGSFEASTFVKRLKAASRAQMDIASGLNTGTIDAFGLRKENTPNRPLETSKMIGEQAKEESENVFLIQSDLSAFITRKPDRRFTSLLQAMKDDRVVRELETMPEIMSDNLSGQSIASSEFWADTLDRWAEELVAAASGPP